MSQGRGGGGEAQMLILFSPELGANKFAKNEVSIAYLVLCHEKTWL